MRRRPPPRSPKKKRRKRKRRRKKKRKRKRKRRKRKKTPTCVGRCCCARPIAGYCVLSTRYGEYRSRRAASNHFAKVRVLIRRRHLSSFSIRSILSLHSIPRTLNKFRIFEV